MHVAQPPFTSLGHQQLLDGADFGEMAVRYSQSDTSLRGGSLGWIEGQQIPSFFVDVLTGMEAGDVSQPFRTSSSFHIVKVNELRSAIERSEVNQTKARHILITPNEIIDDATAQQQLEGALDRIEAGEDFAAVAKQYSQCRTAAEGGDLASGGELFAQNCASCHGALGEGVLADVNESLLAFRVKHGCCFIVSIGLLTIHYGCQNFYIRNLIRLHIKQVFLENYQIRVLANLDAPDLGFHTCLVGTTHGGCIQTLFQGKRLAHGREKTRVLRVGGVTSGNRGFTLDQGTHELGIGTWYICGNAYMGAAINERPDWLEVGKRPLFTDDCHRAVQTATPCGCPYGGQVDRNLMLKDALRIVGMRHGIMLQGVTRIGVACLFRL